MTPQDAQRRLQILHFLDEHGLEAPLDAFGVSSRTLYRWKATLKAQGGNPAALAAQSSAPKQRRTPQTDARLVAENRRLRTLYPKLVKAKLDVLLAPWCVQHGITLASVSTLGRIIARAPDKMRQTLARLNSLGQRKPLRRNPCPTHRPRPAVGPDCAAPTPKTLLSDNGGEFEGDFDRLLKLHRIQRWHAYPKTPKMNAHAERPHHALGQKSPLSFLIQHQPECQRYWTHTPC